MEHVEHGLKEYRRGCRCSMCKSANNERSRLYRATNKERIRRTSKTWRENNKDRINAYQKQKRDENIERYKGYKKKQYLKHSKEINKKNRENYYIRREYYNLKRREWHFNNIERDREKLRAYKRKRRTAIGFCSPVSLKQRWQFYGNKCWICGENACETDHVIPISKGGTNWPANLRPICKPCNRKKSGKKLTILQIANRSLDVYPENPPHS